MVYGELVVEQFCIQDGVLAGLVYYSGDRVDTTGFGYGDVSGYKRGSWQSG
jgi:hypothetical protein